MDCFTLESCLWTLWLYLGAGDLEIQSTSQPSCYQLEVPFCHDVNHSMRNLICKPCIYHTTAYFLTSLFVSIEEVKIIFETGALTFLRCSINLVLAC